MVLEMIALASGVIVSMILPLVVLGLVVKKNREQWKGMIVSFLCGGLIYVVMQWGLKEHGLTWLFNNTSFMNFMEQHYIPYLLVVAFAGAVLAIAGQLFILAVPFKRSASFAKALLFAMGYSMAESTLLVGVRSVNTMIQLIKGSDLELDVSATELFLSDYERVLLMLIEIAIVVTLTYFVQKHQSVRGAWIAIFCHTLVAFLPGFFIAFSLTDYYEVFDRSTTLIMVYILLTACAIASVLITKVMKNLLPD